MSYPSERFFACVVIVMIATCVSGCQRKSTITSNVRDAVTHVPGHLIAGSFDYRVAPVLYTNVPDEVVRKVASLQAQFRKGYSKAARLESSGSEAGRLALDAESARGMQEAVRFAAPFLNVAVQFRFADESADSAVNPESPESFDYVEVEQINSAGIIASALSEIAASAALPMDPWYHRQYGLPMIQADLAYERAKGTPGLGVKIAHLDTGVAYRNFYENGKTFVQSPDLRSGNVIGEFDYIDNDLYPLDLNGHGTHTASIIAEDTGNGIGGAGTAPGAKVGVYRVLNANSNGSDSGFAAAVRNAADKGYQIISVSLGGGESMTKRNAVEYALAKGAIITAAAGNDGTSNKFYPAAYPGVISVVAIDANKAKASYSNYGSWVTISAPGVGIRQMGFLPESGCYYETSCFGELRMDGTSMAQPFVAAGVAIWLSEARKAGITLTREQIFNLIASSSENLGVAGRDDYFGHGLLQIQRGTNLIVAPPSQSPSVSFSSPRSGAELAGIVTLTATANDDRGVAALEFRIDGERIIRLTDGSRSVFWDSASVSDGNHILSTRAIDTDGLVAISQLTISTRNGKLTIPENSTPTANAGPSRSVAAGDIVSFDGSDSYDIGGQIVSYEWDFSDGTPHAFGPKVSHTYKSPGTYPAVLRITDNSGATGAAVAQITVSSKFHVQAVSLTVEKIAPSVCRAQATVSIADGALDPVPGVGVTVNFTGSLSSSGATAYTDANGRAALMAAGICSPGSITATVTRLSASGWVYDASADRTLSGTANTP
ncbi:MAG TPA: S8 family serine peptidase [Bdellovibrionota bacterium]|nr:S8 family serine peptidase [Bdellovibrionota bacterium]